MFGDFIKRLDSLYHVDIDDEELNALLTTIKNQGDEIEDLKKALDEARAKLGKMSKAEEEKPVKKAAAKKPAVAKKSTTKKTKKEEA